MSDTKVAETIREEARDTTIIIQEDEALIKALLECDSTGQVRMKELLEYKAGNKLRPPEVSIRDNILAATAKVDSLAIYVTLKDRYREKETSKTVTEVIPVNILTRWQKTRIYIANTVLILLPFWVAYRFRNKLIQLLK